MIKLITLKTNHTLMGEVEEKVGCFVIKHPVQVVTQPSQQGPMIGFVPFVEYAQEFKTGFTIDVNDILFVSNPVIELENQYNQMFGSGIQIASVIPKV